MNDFLPFVQPVSIVVLVGICFKLASNLNGRLSNKVNRETCHMAINAIHDKIDTLDKHLSEDIREVKSDVKELLKLNGKK